MSLIKISELPLATSISGTDVVSGVQSSLTKKIKTEDILMTASTGTTRWKSVRYSILATKVPASGSPSFGQFKDNGAGSKGVYLYWFDPSTPEEVYFTLEAPTDWKEGSEIYGHLAWVPKVNGAVGAKVCWAIETAIQNEGSVFGDTQILSCTTSIPDEDLVASKLYFNEFIIDASTMTINSCMIFRLFRDADSTYGTDDYTGDAGAVSLGIKYQVDSLGASARLSK